MADLKRTSSERAHEKDCCIEENLYPWGLQIRLEDEELKKLGIERMSVGTDVSFMAKATVTGMSENEREDGVDRCLTLQIKSMEMPSQDNSDDVAKRLYGDSE